MCQARANTANTDQDDNDKRQRQAKLPRRIAALLSNLSCRRGGRFVPRQKASKPAPELC